jgi:hypothetical protein
MCQHESPRFVGSACAHRTEALAGSAWVLGGGLSDVGEVCGAAELLDAGSDVYEAITEVRDDGTARRAHVLGMSASARGYLRTGTHASERKSGSAVRYSLSHMVKKTETVTQSTLAPLLMSAPMSRKIPASEPRQPRSLIICAFGRVWNTGSPIVRSSVPSAQFVEMPRLTRRRGEFRLHGCAQRKAV